MEFTPGFIRGEAVASIIDALHQHAQSGPWHLESVSTDEFDVGPVTTMTFTVGYLKPFEADDRARVTITVKEDK